MSAAESEVVTLVNQQRAANDLGALTVNASLANMARVKSQDMITNNYFAHQSPTYGSPFDMMKQFGISFTAAGENIAYGQPTAQSVMDAWMNSPGHRANILNSSYTQIGVGAVKNSNGTIYWTQEFIHP
ncbi:MAG: CAP domain-containing protein [Ethanoligenens sp.]